MPIRDLASRVQWRLIGLGASLLLNVLLLGVIAGHAFTTARPERRFGGALLTQSHVRALPADERLRFAAAMGRHRDAIRTARQAHRRARLAAEADIGAPDLDIAKLTTDLADLRHASEAVQAATNEGLVDSLSTLSPVSRAALVKRPPGTP